MSQINGVVVSRIKPKVSGTPVVVKEPEVDTVERIRQLQITLRGISKWNADRGVHPAYEGVKSWIKKHSEIALLPPCTKYAIDLFWHNANSPKLWEPSLKAKFQSVLSEEEYKTLITGNNKRYSMFVKYRDSFTNFRGELDKHLQAVEDLIVIATKEGYK